MASGVRATDALGGGVGAPGRARIPDRTLRRDRWWVQPALTAAGLTAWLLYGLVRAASQENYWVPAYKYLTPFASPCLSTSCARRVQPLRDAFRGLPAADPVRDPHAAVPAGLPADLLLLPQGLLPVVLAVPAGLRGRRAARAVHRRDPVPADPAEHPPVLLLRGLLISRHPDLRRDPRVPRRGRRVGHGPGHRHPAGQRRADLALHAVLPLLPAHHRRQAQALLPAPGAIQGVAAVSKLNARHMLLAWVTARSRSWSPTSTSCAGRPGTITDLRSSESSPREDRTDMTEHEDTHVRRRRHRRRWRRPARRHRGPRGRACAPPSSASRCSARPTP